MQPDARRFRFAADITLCIGFFTRLPTPSLAGAPRLADALWAAPLAGALIGLAVGLILLAALAVGLVPMIATAIALASGILLTGALHEDGLADVADGFGGGRDREAKLSIMRDSRIGTYGVIAVALSLLLRWSALVALAPLPWAQLLPATVAAHAVSRALLPVFMASVPLARHDGLSAHVGAIQLHTAVICAMFGVLALAALGPAAMAVCGLCLVAAFFLLSRLCRRQIGGQTGDVLGTLQQVTETLVLIIASATLGKSP